MPTPPAADAPAVAPAAPAPQPSPQPATTPATPVPTPTPAAAPIPATPAPTPAAAPAAGVNDTKFTPTMETPLQYEAKDGKMVDVTVGDLINMHDKVSGMDMAQIEDINGALNNDPDATRRMLTAQLEKAAPVAPPTDEKGMSDRMLALETQNATMSEQLGRASKVTQQVEDNQQNEYIRAVLVNPQVAEKLPFLAAKPEAAVPIIKRHIANLRAAATAAGQDIRGRNDLLSNCLANAEAEVKALVGAYGGAVTPAQTAAAVTAAAVPKAIKPGDVVTPATQHQMYNPPPVPTVNPQAIQQIPGRFWI